MKKILFLFVAAFVCALGANAEVWKKVTSAPADWSGKYLIACDNGEDWAVLDGSRSGDPTTGNLQSSMNYKPYEVNSDGDIVLDACDYYVTIAKSGDAYTICTASGWYIGNNSDANTLGTTANAELAFLSTISLDAEQGAIIKAVEGGSVLRYNNSNGQDRFRYYKSSTYTNQQKIALYKLEEAPVVPEVNGYVAATSETQLKAGQEVLIINRYGWGAGTWRSSDYMWYHNTDMDEAEVAGNPMFVYDGDVNTNGCPTTFLLEDASEGKFYLKDLATGKYLNGAYSLSQSDEPTTPWTLNGTDAEMRYFEVYYDYNGSKRYLAYGGWVSGGPLIAAASSQEQPKRIYVKGGVSDQPEVGGNWTGEAILSVESISNISDLEGMTITLPGAKSIKVLEDEGVLLIQNKNGSELYALWAPSYGGSYEIKDNVITLHDFFVHPQLCSAIPEGTEVLYVEDYGTFIIDGKPEYIDNCTIAYAGAPVAQPFELIVKNNNITCANGAKVEAAEAGVASDFYFGNQGLTAVGKTATLYKDGTAMSFSYTMVSASGISFFGGASQFTEPGTYLLEVPAGTYTDVAGNPNAAFYGQWVIIEKGPSYVEPVLKAEDVSDEVAYYIYTTARGGLTVQSTTSTQLVGTSEAGVGQSVDPTDVRQQFAFVNWEGNLYLYSVATQKFIGKSNRGTFTDEPVDPIYFKNAYNGTVMLYFDDNFNINLGGSKQVTIDTWKTKDAGNSFIIKVAEPFDQTDIFDRLNPKAWDRDLATIGWSEANTLDELLDVTVDFTSASSVEASGYDILGVVFDTKGLPYAVALCNGVFDSFGTVDFDKSKANVKFQKIAELSASNQEAAKAALKKIGGFQPAAGEACVVFSAKSFVVDGLLLDELLVKNYVLSGEGTVTGINGINVDTDAQIFDLQGRRVNATKNGLYIVNGVKVVR